MGRAAAFKSAAAGARSDIARNLFLCDQSPRFPKEPLDCLALDHRYCLGARNLSFAAFFLSSDPADDRGSGLRVSDDLFLHATDFRVVARCRCRARAEIL